METKVTVSASFKDGRALSSSTVRGDAAGRALKSGVTTVATKAADVACSTACKAAYGAGYVAGFVGTFIKALRS